MPIVAVGIVGALLLSLLAVFALNNNAAPVSTPTFSLPVATPTQVVIEIGGSQPTQAVQTEDAPRMPLDQFKALYDNEATRPVVVDVRGPEAYNEGHILGAINVPFDAVGANLVKLPKDKLIVAYCQ